MKRHSTLCVVEDLMGCLDHEIAVFEYTFLVNDFCSKFKENCCWNICKGWETHVKDENTPRHLTTEEN